MFLFLSQIAILDAAVHHIEAIRKRNEWIDTLPKDEQDAIRKKDLQESKEREEHRKKLEIAEAGRPRNFFGK